jgi:uncharacterized protein
VQSSIFNLRVPLAGGDVFLMNTLTDAQVVVSVDVAELLERRIDSQEPFDPDTREAVALLQENGFLVESRDRDRSNLNEYIAAVKHDSSELNVTVLTTLQCNFACDYCYQGDRDDYNKFAEKMSLETAARVGDWIERELDRVRPEKLALTFFGGEPLLNLPVLYYLAERLSHAARSRDVKVGLSIITNGLLLTEEVVDRLLPWGLRGVKITLDGDKETHDRMRPLRGGQGTFDRIVENIRRVAGRCPIAIGGNFDEQSATSYPALLQFLKEQEFADKLVKVNFKPVVRSTDGGSGTRFGADRRPSLAQGGLRLTPVGSDGAPAKPLGGTCMTSVGKGVGTTCDSCDALDDTMAFLRNETERLGFTVPDGVHNGPCHVHMAHAHTIGPDGSLYACPGFTGELGLSTGHIDDRRDAEREARREQFDRLNPWKDCGDCAFIPVCAGGCLVASHTQAGDMNTPTCHKPSYESALIAMAHDAARAAQETVQ